MKAAGPKEDRLRALVKAGVAIASELSLDALLQRLVEKAAELTGARYAALGVIDRGGSGLEQFVTQLFTNFVEIHGDRRFADDHAIMTGFAEYRGDPVLVVGHVKGAGGDTKDKIFRNFGYARPEGYRKALRTMRLAEKFGRPIIVFIDTPAAYPGIESEERGVAEAIAVNLREMMMLDTSVIVIVSGEGGSGGALGIAVGDAVLMQEYAIYSVIPPEGCAAILWRDANRKVEAAEALKLTAPDLLKAAIIDEIVPEPIGGAHTDPAAASGDPGLVVAGLAARAALMRAESRGAHYRTDAPDTRPEWRGRILWRRDAPPQFEEVPS